MFLWFSLYPVSKVTAEVETGSTFWSLTAVTSLSELQYPTSHKRPIMFIMQTPPAAQTCRVLLQCRNFQNQLPMQYSQLHHDGML